MASVPLRVVVKEEISQPEAESLAKYIDMYFTGLKLRKIEEASYKKVESGWKTEFYWRQVSDDGSCRLGVSLKIALAVEVQFENFDLESPAQMALYSKTLDLTENLVLTYFQNAKTQTIYFVVGSGGGEAEAEAPTKSSVLRSILRRIFSGNATNAFLLFLVLSYALFLFIGDLTVMVVIAMQLVYLFYADAISLNLGNVRPDIARRVVAVIGVRTNRETIAYLGSRGKSVLKEIRKEAENLVLPIGTSSSSANETIKNSLISVLSRNGIRASVEDVQIKIRNVYDLVANVCDKFGRPVPKIVVSNSPVSNAMATGISTKRSSIMITAGSLLDLTDEELESVVGHEIGHVKGHDPVILFGVSSLVYIGAFYVWYPLFEVLGLFYYIVAFGLLFAVGKVLETRADTESAATLGDAKALATSLTKIGFRQLYQEKYSQLGRFLDWFRFDPHPPIYFRIARLSALAGRENTIKHTFLSSLGDCVTGFFASI
jgi:heat shock protein HtpX